MTPRKALGYVVRLAEKKAEANERQINEMVTPLVQALTHPDESCRQQAVEHVQRACLAAVIGRLIDRLVDLLVGGRELVRRQALASLVQFGLRALPSLARRFSRTRSAALQQCILVAIGQIARGLGQEQRCNLIDLTILSPFAVDDLVRQGLAEILAMLPRRTN